MTIFESILVGVGVGVVAYLVADSLTNSSMKQRAVDVQDAATVLGMMKLL